MKTLENHTLIYDCECPLCNAYTGGFVKYGLLDEKGRTAYRDFAFDSTIDRKLACNKIALVNNTTHEVTYGIDSLLKILASRFPLIGKIGSVGIVHSFLELLYAFISYNRKMIAPGKVQSDQACVPSRNVWARGAFVLFCAAAVHVLVTWYFNAYCAAYKTPGLHVPDFALFCSQLLLQGITFRLLRQKGFYDYAGHMSFVSLLGALSMLLAGVAFKVLAAFGVFVGFVAIVVYGAVLMVMFYEHMHRVKLYGWSGWLCLSWVVFRLLIYPLVFKL